MLSNVCSILYFRMAMSSKFCFTASILPSKFCAYTHTLFFEVSALKNSLNLDNFTTYYTYIAVMQLNKVLEIPSKTH